MVAKSARSCPPVAALLAAIAMTACTPTIPINWEPAGVADFQPRTEPALVVFRSGPPETATVLDGIAALQPLGDLSVELNADATPSEFGVLESALAAEAARRGGDFVVVVGLEVDQGAAHGGATTLRARVFRAERDTTHHQSLVLGILFAALRDGHVEQVERVLHRRVDLDTPWRGGETPLTAAIKWTRPPDDAVLRDNPEERAREEGREESIRLLLREGADPNVLNTNGEHPLALAGRQGTPGLEGLLERYGAELPERD